MNCEKNVVPIPTMTASTITLMPDEMTLPRTRSARNAVLPQSAKGTSTKPASVVSLNSRMVMKSCTARMKKARTTMNQAPTKHENRDKVREDGREAHQLAGLLQQAAKPP